jgi:hypothetical protein
MVDFCAGGLFYMYEATGKLDLITGDDVGGEVALKIKIMKEMRAQKAAE